ncbi:hypothetical protein [Streptomyces azureus]|uniref:Uncharacterized protein n=1 Tax=Streptomyces azureus TaxID=146537 RepID=A0A0K8PH78_STRAJ|nr:hypothetical protein [Streptomyces azureus]GAP47073.1 uncharacterized protein SAZU_1810 [Streptomyces azureus]
MARITVRVEPRHTDNSLCDHAVKPSGRPCHPGSGCPGRTQFAVVCSEHGDVGEPHHGKVLAEPAAVDTGSGRPAAPAHHPRSPL